MNLKLFAHVTRLGCVRVCISVCVCKAVQGLNAALCVGQPNYAKRTKKKEEKWERKRKDDCVASRKLQAKSCQANVTCNL